MKDCCIDVHQHEASNENISSYTECNSTSLFEQCFTIFWATPDCLIYRQRPVRLLQVISFPISIYHIYQLHVFKAGLRQGWPLGSQWLPSANLPQIWRRNWWKLVGFNCHLLRRFLLNRTIETSVGPISGSLLLVKRCSSYVEIEHLRLCN